MLKSVVLLWAVVLCCAPAAFCQAVPTFVGVRTFLGAPYVANLDELHADFAVLGVPFDEGRWGWPGERYGPRAMRESSQEYNHDLTEGFYYSDGAQDSREGSVPHRFGQRSQPYVSSVAGVGRSGDGDSF